MQLNIQITGLDEVRRSLGEAAKQANFAASRALNTTAFAINGEIKKAMQSTFKGGATAFTLRAFSVGKASKGNLTASVMLRKDAPPGGTSYTKALQHLFNGGTRDWKRLEGYLRGIGMIPSGMMAAPGKGCPLDSYGNIRRPALTEMLGVIRANLRNLRVFRRTGAGKAQKAVGYFVVQKGDKTSLHPGIWKRIETGKSSTVSPMVMFVTPGQWRSLFDLQRIGNETVSRVFNAEFNRELSAALSTAK